MRRKDPVEREIEKWTGHRTIMEQAWGGLIALLAISVIGGLIIWFSFASSQP